MIFVTIQPNTSVFSFFMFLNKICTFRTLKFRTYRTFRTLKFRTYHALFRQGATATIHFWNSGHRSRCSSQATELCCCILPLVIDLPHRTDSPSLAMNKKQRSWLWIRNRDHFKAGKSSPMFSCKLRFWHSTTVIVCDCLTRDCSWLFDTAGQFWHGRQGRHGLT